LTYLLPPGSGATPVTVSASGGGAGFGGGVLTFPALGLGRVGRWLYIAQLNVNPHPSGNNWPQAQILVNGAAVINLGNFDIASGVPVTSTYTFAGLITANAPTDYAQLWLNPVPSTGTYVSWTHTAYFVPTPTYPR
jgi:hypothetical protein